ncbi:MAG: all3515 family Zur-repressed PEP-CTERM protein [Pirellulales bacterium]
MRAMGWGRVAALVGVGALVVCGQASAQLAEFYVGIDSRTAPFSAPVADGGGAYPDNPNSGRLTLLFNHVDHFHGLGTYRYVGPAASSVLDDTSANNRVPEISTGQAPLPLVPGSGAYAGKNVTLHLAGVEYSDLELRNVQSLAGVDEVLFHSSTDRWSGAFAAADVHLKLLSVSSPHLNVGSLTDPAALPVGGDVHLGEGSELFSFTPVLWVALAAPAGDYWAEFQLVDESGTYGNSGRFFIDVRHAVPEPASLLMFLGGVSIVGLNLRRRS